MLKKVSYAGLTMESLLVFVQPIACNTVLDFLKKCTGICKTINVTFKTLSYLAAGSLSPLQCCAQVMTDLQVKAILLDVTIREIGNVSYFYL